MTVTAKVLVSSMHKPGGAGEGSTTVHFGPDYGNDNGEKNKEWAVATPALSITMTVKDEIAATHFAPGKPFTLVFEEAE